MSSVSKRVTYYYENNIGNYYYGPGHPMKPNRVRMTNHLITEYGLFKKMEIYRPLKLDLQDMKKFHSDEYVDFLSNITVENSHTYEKDAVNFLGKTTHSDCPIFHGLFEYCQIYSGASVGGAIKLNHELSDVVINWAGGFHHAKKSEATGFCYINDIVLAILELLKFHKRVLYIDIDVHHGDGVEEAFYCTNRVMTLSYHKGGDFFPGTGTVNDNGIADGKNYSLNFPLHEGIDDDAFVDIFIPTTNKVIEAYDPSVIVLQCGADSLAGDRLGCFNLTLKGHGECVKAVINKNIPTLVLGGGGYTIKNVSRCWAYETAICLDTPLKNELPINEYYEYYGPDYELHIPPINIENKNTLGYLHNVQAKVFEFLRELPHVPSVQFIKSRINNGVIENFVSRKEKRISGKIDEKEFYDNEEKNENVKDKSDRK